MHPCTLEPLCLTGCFCPPSSLYLSRRGEQKAKMRSAVLTRLEAMLDASKLAGTINSGQFESRAGLVASGVPALDTRLGGGWRCGEISELIGARSTGRTSVLAATLATATSSGAVAAVVD